jgi:O-antigen/teichoic acid export membrane protein
LHRGANWQNAQRLTSVVALGICLWMRASFPVLAASQVVTMAGFTIIVAIEIRLRAPVLLPSVRYGTMKDLLAVLKPSAYYALFALSSFFAWQGPVLLLEKILGPVAVAIFALSRTIFSMSRQLLISLTYSIGQETIQVIARRSWAQLLRMYDLSERVILLFIPCLTVGTYLAAPFLFTIWLHQRTLYRPEICLLMAIVSSVVALKEHKYVFQYLSNQHEAISRFSLIAYGAMLVVSALPVKLWGDSAFMIVWLITELSITAFIIKQNRKLFPPEFHPSLATIPRLALILAAAFSIAGWLAWHGEQWPLRKVTGVAIAASIGLLCVSYFAFGVSAVRSVVQSRLRARFASAVR